MLDPRTIMVAMPCGDGRVMAETMGMLVSARNMFAGVMPVSECSVVQLARNVIADQFLSSTYEWLVCVDSDIVPSPEDFRLLLEPCDVEAQYWDGSESDDNMPSAGQPRPSRVITGQLTPQAGKPLDFNSKTAGSADMLVCSEYAYKNDTLEPVKLGFGFVRIHRIVFEKLQELKHPENPLRPQYDKALEKLEALFTREHDAVLEHEDILEVLKRSRPDPGGGPRLWQGSYQGKIITDYFPTGPMLSTFVPTAQWKGEDHGFFTLCHMAGIIARIETRTRLTHIGRKGYQYQGPEYGGGQ